MKGAEVGCAREASAAETVTESHETETSKQARRRREGHSTRTQTKVSVAERSTELCKFGQNIAIPHVQGS
jgi:hypothetical protein